MKHATYRAAQVLAGKLDEPTIYTLLCAENSCDCPGKCEHWAFVDAHAQMLINDPKCLWMWGQEYPSLEKSIAAFKSVDCPTCRVLLDVALEGKVIDVNASKETSPKVTP